MADKTPDAGQRAARYDHSFLNRDIVLYSMPAMRLLRQHLPRLDGSFLRLANDFVWLNDDREIEAMMRERSQLIATFEAELDSVIPSYTETLQRHHVGSIVFERLRPAGSVSFELHAATSLEAIRLFMKLDRLFLLLEAMKQNGLIDELAYVHTCQAWKRSLGRFVKAVHALRIRLLAESHERNARDRAIESIDAKEKTDEPTTT